MAPRHALTCFGLFSRDQVEECSGVVIELKVVIRGKKLKILKNQSIGLRHVNDVFWPFLNLGRGL